MVNKGVMIFVFIIFIACLAFIRQSEPTGFHSIETQDHIASYVKKVPSSPVLLLSRFTVVSGQTLVLNLSRILRTREEVTYNSMDSIINDDILTYTPPPNFIGETPITISISGPTHNTLRTIHVTVTSPSQISTASSGTSISAAQTISTPFSSCGAIVTAGMFELTTNLTSSGTCLSLEADNIEIDCQGFNISYANASSSDAYAINASDRTNITVRNCNMFVINSTGNSHQAIHFNNTSVGLITNNNISTTGSDSNSGIRLRNTSNITVSNNFINASGATGGSNVGIEHLGSAGNNTITNNTIYTQGQSGSEFGISFVSLGGTVENNTVNLNTIFTGTNAAAGDSGNYGIYVDPASLMSISENTITTNGDNSNFGIELVSVSTSTVYYNVINTGGLDFANYGIDSMLSTFSDISYNIITTGGTFNNFGIELASSDFNTITGNTVTTGGTDCCNTGIDVSSSMGNTLFANTITANGVDCCNFGIETRGVSPDSNSILFNIIAASGVGAFDTSNIGISITNGDGTIITGNTITTTGVGSTNVGILAVSGQSSISQNTITTDGTIDNHGIEIGTSGNTVDFNTISTGGMADNHGIFFDSPVSQNTLDSNTISTRGSYGLAIANSNGTYTNNVLINVTDWFYTDPNTDNNLTNTTFATPNGSIRFPGTINILGQINATKEKMNISFNSSFLNSSNLTVLNTSAEISLENITFYVPQAVVDFEDDGTFMNCTGPQCVEVSYVSSRYVFGVTGFTTYAVTEGLGVINLTATKVGMPDPVAPGTILTYTIVVTNSGSATAFNVTVVDILSPQLVYTSSIPANLTADTYSLGNITPGNSSSITILALVNATTPTGTILNNTINVTFQNITNSTFLFNATTNTTVAAPRTGGGGIVLFTPALIVPRARNYTVPAPEWTTPGLAQRDSLLIDAKIGDSSANQTIVITVLNVVANQATLSVAPPGREMVLATGGKQIVDINFDGAPDVQIELLSIERDLVRLRTTLIRQEKIRTDEVRVPVREAPTITTGRATSYEPPQVQQITTEVPTLAELPPVENKKGGAVAILLILAVILGAVLFIITYRLSRNPPKPKYQQPLFRSGK